MNAAGDKKLSNSLESLAKLWDKYSSEIESIKNSLNEGLNKVRAIVEPTATNKIKAVSSPDPIQIRENILEGIRGLGDYKKRIKEELDSILKICNEKKVLCENCGGSGYVRIRKIVREGPIIDEFYDDMECDKCNKSGYLVVSKELCELVSTILKPFSSLFPNT